MNIIDVPLADIEEAPFNYNLHPQNQIDELRGSLEEFGQFKNIVLWNGYCIAGNGLTYAARSMGWESLKAIIRDDLTEEQAKRLCVADNATPYLAVTDSEKLNELLNSIPSFDDIPGVDMNWLEELGIINEELINIDQEWQGIPDFEQNEIKEWKSILVRFDTQDDFMLFSKSLGQKLTEKTKSFWFPHIPERLSDQLGTKANLIYTEDNES